MPAMGESVTEGTVLEWHVAEGDRSRRATPSSRSRPTRSTPRCPRRPTARSRSCWSRSTTWSRSAPPSPSSSRAATELRRKWLRRPRSRRRRRTRSGGGRAAIAGRSDASMPTARVRARPATTDDASVSAGGDDRRGRAAGRDARDGRVGHRGHRARVARRRGRRDQRGRHDRRGLDRQGRRRGPGARRAAPSPSSWSRSTTRSTVGAVARGDLQLLGSPPGAAASPSAAARPAEPPKDQRRTAAPPDASRTFAGQGHSGRPADRRRAGRRPERRSTARAPAAR